MGELHRQIIQMHFLHFSRAKEQISPVINNLSLRLIFQSVYAKLCLHMHETLIARCTM